MTSTPTPPRTDPAKLTAAKNNALLVRRALYTGLADGRLDFRGALDLAAHNKVVADTRVRFVLAALPRWSPARAAAAMEEAKISPKRTMGGLRKIDSQTQAILAVLYRPSRRTVAARPHEGWPYWTPEAAAALMAGAVA